MKFTDYSNERYIDLKIKPGSHDEKRLVEISAREFPLSLSSEIPITEIFDLVDWFENMQYDQRYPDYHFRSLPLHFDFGHVEKGEFHYYVRWYFTGRGNKKLYEIHSWEQGDYAAQMRATDLRREIG